MPYATFKKLESIYTKRNVNFMIIVACAFGLVSSMPQWFPCCRLVYFYDEYAWGYDFSLIGNIRFVWYERFVVACTLVLLCFCYSKILIVHRNRAKMVSAQNSTAAAQKEKAEFRLAIQFALLVLAMIAYVIAVTVVPEYVEDSFGESVAYFFYLSLNPFLYLLFNRDVRRAVVALLKGRKGLESEQNTALAAQSRWISKRTSQTTARNEIRA